jgi:hypothetical protein
MPQHKITTSSRLFLSRPLELLAQLAQLEQLELLELQVQLELPQLARLARLAQQEILALFLARILLWMDSPNDCSVQDM